MLLSVFCNKLLQQRGFTHPRIASEHHKRRLVDKAVFQDAVGRAMRRARIQKVAIRQERKGFNPKIIKRLIHSTFAFRPETLEF